MLIWYNNEYYISAVTWRWVLECDCWCDNLYISIRCSYDWYADYKSTLLLLGVVVWKAERKLSLKPIDMRYFRLLLFCALYSEIVLCWRLLINTVTFFHSSSLNSSYIVYNYHRHDLYYINSHIISVIFTQQRLYIFISAGSIYCSFKGRCSCYTQLNTWSVGEY